MDAAGDLLCGLRGQRVVCPDVDRLVERLADELVEAARCGLRERGAFQLALSGGSTPAPLYRRLSGQPDFPWPRTELWLVDERCVDPDDDRSNFRMIRELIVDRVAIPGARVHPMPVLEADGDRRYEAALRSALEASAGRLDFVLLGMGADGHTASLFPHSPALSERERWVVFNDGPRVTPPRPRMTMTYPLLNAARSIALLVTSEGKHATLSRVSGSPGDPERFPVGGIDPVHADALLCWYLDRAAATGRSASGA